MLRYINASTFDLLYGSMLLFIACMMLKPAKPSTLPESSRIKHVAAFVVDRAPSSQRERSRTSRVATRRASS
jgi:hypothetical protein